MSGRMGAFGRSMFKDEMSTGTALDEGVGFYASAHCLRVVSRSSSLMRGQVASIQIAISTPLSVQLLQHVPMKTGEALEGRLLYPIYVENLFALPVGTVLRGRVVQLDSDHSRRIHARLRGDFTPFHPSSCISIRSFYRMEPYSRLRVIGLQMALRFCTCRLLPAKKSALSWASNSPGKTEIEGDSGSLHGTRARRPAG